jgi:hypothetical protein
MASEQIRITVDRATVGDVRETLRDAEDWIADVRAVLEYRDAGFPVTSAPVEVVLASVPDLDGAGVRADAPAIAHKRLRPGDVMTDPIGPGPIVPPCYTGASVCDPTTEQGTAVLPADLVHALRAIEVMVGTCRVLLEKMGSEEPIRPSV